MAARKAWEDYTPAYRRRLTRKGIGPGDAGKPRTAARGHGQTPEHPEQAVRNPQKYRDYLERSSDLNDRVLAHKELLFGNTIKWRSKGAFNAVKKPRNRAGDYVRRNAKIMRQFLTMTQADLDALGEWWQDDSYAFLFYH